MVSLSSAIPLVERPPWVSERIASPQAARSLQFHLLYFREPLQLQKSFPRVHLLFPTLISTSVDVQIQNARVDVWVRGTGPHSKTGGDTATSRLCAQ